jgi:hypothetical protein
MKSRTVRLFSNSPRALESLRLQLQKGSPLKSLGIRLLIEMSTYKALLKLPVLKDLLFTAQGLVAGHIAEIELIDSLSTSNSSNYEGPKWHGLTGNKTVDVVIIGSGPGAVEATEIELKCGIKDIFVLERGNTPKTPHSLHHSLTHVVQDFSEAGQELIIASGFPLYAQANVIGGGSEVNSGLYHDLPPQNLKDYSAAFGVSEDLWLKEERLTFDKLKPIAMSVLPDQSLLARGAIEASLSYKNIPRWRTYHDDGSFQHRGMNEVYWNATSNKSPVTLVGNCEVLSISVKNPEYVQVFCRDTLSGKKSVITSNRIHLSAGAISTPILLARSGIIRWRDTKFAWHPMVRLVARTQTGDLGSGDIDPFQAWTDDRKLKFGAAVSTAPLLSIALGRPVSLNEASELRSYYVSYSSSGKGGLVPILGLPWYKFSKLDRKLARDGVDLLKKLITLGGGKVLNSEKVSYKKFSTVHIFGTLPINSNIYVPGTNQLKVDRRISVSDASILPFGPGVNPQGVVMTAVRVANLGKIVE